MIFLKYLSLSFLVFLFSCSTVDVAGSKGGSETTNGVTACILHSNGIPASGSSVHLRPVDYISKPTASESMVTFKTDTITDSEGRFTINGLKPGTYCVEVQDIRNTVLFTFSIDSIDTVDLGIDSLYPFATLNGSIDTIGIGKKQLFAQIRGLERLARVNNDGSFVFDDLPEGFLDVVISDSASSKPSKEVLNVNTISGDTLSVSVSGSSIFSGFINVNSTESNIPSSAVLTNFPLLIRFDSSSFDFNQAHPNGDDIHFVKTDNTILPHEIELWDPISQTAAVWVKIDTIYGNRPDQSIIMKWGEVDVISQSNGATVFDTINGFAGVWHFNEDPSIGTGAIKDRTINVFHGTSSSSITSDNMEPGISSTGLSFNGINDSINAGLLQLDGNYTLSCWVKPSSSPSINWRFIIKETSYTLWYDSKWNGVRVEHFTDGFVWHGIYQDTDDSIPYPLSLETWNFVTSTYDGDKVRLYINGEIADSSLSIALNPRINNDTPLLFGGRENEFFKGVMDEVRIENKARSADWIRLCYRNQHPESNIVKIKLR